MNQCPICKTDIKESTPNYCKKCAWEFEYYFDELNQESKEVYKDRLKIWSEIYTKSISCEKNFVAPTISVEKSFDFEPEMVLIKRGEFMMGSDEFNDTKPIHKVTIDYDFEIGKYPVTFEEYDYYCENVNKAKPYDNGFGRGKRPVINVSWNDAKEYTKWLSQKTGKNYRLPSEAEWEYVARAGTETRWSFGDGGSDLNEYAWYSDNSYDLGQGHKDYGTHKVGTKKANPWGVYDVHGNVSEWCEDWYLNSYNKTPKDGTAQEEKIGVFSKILNEKVLRGGSWNNWSGDSCSGNRYGGNLSIRSNNIGFRILRTLV